MKIARIISLAVILSLTGCSILFNVFRTSPGVERGSAIQAEGYAPAAGDRFAYGSPAGCRAGDWVKYRIAADKEIRIAVKEIKDDIAQIEIVETNGEKTTTLLQDVAPDGAVVRSLFSADGKDPVPQKIERRNREAKGEWPKIEELSVENAAVSISGANIDALKVEEMRTSEDGKTHFETAWWSANIPPLFASSAKGGLVKRVSGKDEILLIGFGRR